MGFNTAALRRNRRTLRYIIIVLTVSYRSLSLNYIYINKLASRELIIGLIIRE